jgi:hypothetical protein
MTVEIASKFGLPIIGSHCTQAAALNDFLPTGNVRQPFRFCTAFACIFVRHKRSQLIADLQTRWQVDAPAKASKTSQVHALLKSGGAPPGLPAAVDGSKSSKQNQNQDNDQDETEATAAIIAGSIEAASPNSAESPQQCDDQNYENDRAY